VSSSVDTSAGARRTQVEALRALDGPTRLRMALQASQMAMDLSAAGIRHRHPEWSDAQVQRALVQLLTGRSHRTSE
jgi:hypothetical protein